MRRINSPKILVIGELNVDIVATGLRRPPELGAEVLAENCELTLGSASAIFAAGMARLGHTVTFVSQVGKDHLGDFCITSLKRLGISTRHVQRKPNEKTGVTIALSGARDRALVTYSGAVATLKADRIDAALLKRHDHLHLTSYYLQDELRSSFARILRDAKALGLTTSFDPNSDPADMWNSDINPVFDHTDVLLLNEREAMRLSKTTTPRAALRTLGAKVDCAVIKRGAKGAMAVRRGKLFTHSGFKVKQVDTTGAGDSFDAGFITAYLHNAPVVDCLESGNACGALSASGVGGTGGQPTEKALRKFIRLRKSAATSAK